MYFGSFISNGTNVFLLDCDDFSSFMLLGTADYTRNVFEMGMNKSITYIVLVL